jgi:hypothetical protein
MGALHKADAYSAVQLLVALATIPAGWLAGTLFESDPRLALAAIIGVLALAALAHALTPGSDRSAQPSKAIGGMGEAIKRVG